MSLNAMLLLLLNLLFHCELLRCDELKPANFDVQPHRRHEYKAKRNDNYMNYAITEVMVNSTPRTDQTIHITTQPSFLTAPLGNETNIHYDPPFSLSSSSQFAKGSIVSTSPEVKPIHSQTGLTTPSNSSSDLIHSTASTVKVSTHIPGPTGSISNGTSYSSHNIARSGVSASSNQSKPCPSSVSYPAITPSFNFDPSVAEVAKKWLHGLSSPITSTPKMLVPKLTLIFDYDLSTQRVTDDIRRNQKNQRKKSNRQSEREKLIKPQKSKESEATSNSFWHNPPKVPSLLTTKRTQTATTATKQRLNPGLLLGKATISGVKNKEDVGENEKITSGSVESQWILRMHKIVEVTKKEWYSDRTEMESKWTETEAPTADKLLLRQNIVPAPTATSAMAIASTTDTSFTLKRKLRQETYMIVFIIELTRLIATKEEKAVHEVVKHTDQILHSFYKSRQLQWVCQPLIDFTKHVAKSLKESEICVIQDKAADLYHMLRKRHQMLPEEVNSVLEYADRLYDEDEGEQLLKMLNEFAAYPNITLNGYWLCNSLINTFLRPFRRLTDAEQRQRLMDSVTLALKTSYTPNETNNTSALRNGVRQADVPPEEAVIRKEASIITTGIPRERKKKRRHRSHKRKRGRKRHRMRRTKPQVEYNYNLMLRSVTPRTGEQPR